MTKRSIPGKIVEAVLERFPTRGFNAAGVKDITDRAGVPKGSSYNHFVGVDIADRRRVVREVVSASLLGNPRKADTCPL